MALRTRKKQRMEESGGDVNITPLLDVLTVLLFFLIKSSTVTSLNLAPPKGLQLPSGESETQAEEAVKVAITQEKLIVDNHDMLQLENGRFPASELEDDQRTIRKLREYLQKNAKKRADFFEGTEGTAEEGPKAKILFQADKELTFGLVKHLLHTAAVSGFADYQFVVVGTNKD